MWAKTTEINLKIKVIDLKNIFCGTACYSVRWYVLCLPGKRKLKCFPVWGRPIFTSPLAFVQNMPSAILLSCQRSGKALATKAKKEDIYKIHVTFWSLVLTISVTIFSVYLNFQNKMKTLLKLMHAIAIANSFNWSGLIVPVLSSLHKLLETAVVTSFLN